MKKVLAFITVLLTASLCYAQTPRNASDLTISHVGRTNFTNIGVNGLDVSGNPGYIALANTSSKSNYQTEYYLWVSENGNLCMASYQTLLAYASFPNGSWTTGGIPCDKVGSQ